MWSMLKKEFNTFFAHPVGYGVVILFLLFNSLLLWVFNSDWNIFRIGFADLQAFFQTTPWLFMFLIPAIAMKSFSDEYTSGTVEILKTRPITSWQVVLGKYFAILSVVTISLFPTLLYAVSVSQLASPEKPDWGAMMGSYLGLWLLGATFSAISLWVSILVKNQLMSFILSIVILFIIYYAPEQLSHWYSGFPNAVRKFDLFTHFQSISRGVIDARDMVYFLSVILLFLLLTRVKYEAE
jgi:ABC-2 type transport system permease protein